MDLIENGWAKQGKIEVFVKNVSLVCPFGVSAFIDYLFNELSMERLFMYAII